MWFRHWTVVEVSICSSYLQEKTKLHNQQFFFGVLKLTGVFFHCFSFVIWLDLMFLLFYLMSLPISSVITSLTQSHHEFRKYNADAGLLCWIMQHVLCSHLFCVVLSVALLHCLRLMCEFHIFV